MTTQAFDGPLELKDMKSVPTSPYAQTTFQPYDPIINASHKSAKFSQVSGDEKDLEFLSSATTSLSTKNATSKQRRLLLIAIIIASGILTYLIHNYEPLKLLCNSYFIIILIGSLSSVLAQLINQFYKRFYSLSNISKFLVWGCINGTLTSLWIDMLIAQFPNIIIRVLADQFLGSPFFQLVFIMLNAIWDNNDIRSSLRVHYLRSLKLSYLIWPSFSILSFSILPPELIFPCNCLVNLIWNVVLSFIT